MRNVGFCPTTSGFGFAHNTSLRPPSKKLCTAAYINAKSNFLEVENYQALHFIAKSKLGSASDSESS